MKRAPTGFVAGVAVGLAVVCASAGLAIADGPTVVVVPFVGKSLEGTAKSKATEKRRLTQAVVQGASAAGKPAELAGLNMADILALGGCKSTDETCLGGLPTALGADVIVFGNIKRDGSKTVVGLLVIEEGEPLVRERVTLTEPGIDGRVSELEAAAGRFFRGEPVSLDVARTEDNLPNSDTAVDSETAADSETAIDSETAEDSDSDSAANSDEADETRTGESFGPSQADVGQDSSSGFDFARVRRTYWVVGAVGLGAVATGSVFLALGSSKQSEIDDHPTRTGADLRNLEELEDQANTLFTVGNVLLIGGVVTTAVAGALIFNQARPRRERSKNEQRGIAVDVVPAIYPGGIGVVATVNGWQ